MTDAFLMRVELTKDNLHHAWRAAVGTLIGAGITEAEAELIAYQALCDLEKDLIQELF